MYHQETFDGLLQFCKDYTSLTNAKVICTVMTGVNPLVASGMKKENCSAEIFIERIQLLSHYATLGYHGHYWLDVSKFNQNEYALHTTTFETQKFLAQFERDLEWFEKHAIPHHGIYAGGWWFMNKFLIEKLMATNFNTDYSFSKAPYFYNAFSANLMIENGIKTGESFSLVSNNSSKTMLCIQNLIGAHNTSFPLDFDRNLKKILDSPNVVGVINAHDYDRNFYNTLRCIEHLLTDSKAKFFSHKDLIELAKSKGLKEILI